MLGCEWLLALRYSIAEYVSSFIYKRYEDLEILALPGKELQTL